MGKDGEQQFERSQNCKKGKACNMGCYDRDMLSQTAAYRGTIARDIEIQLELSTCDHPLMARARERAQQRLSELRAEEAQGR